MKIYKSIESLVGNTPLLELSNFVRENNLKTKIYAKLEFLNPTGSVKDRAALKMIEDAERDNLINDGATLIEPTSGNTGIGIAAMAAAKGYKAIITMPDTMSEERIKLMSAYGAKVVLTDGSKGMAGAIAKAEEIKKSTPNSIVVGQFTNQSNPKAHFETTGPEIWNDTDGSLDIFISAVGTGGTLTGTAKYLKSKNEDIKIVAVEPENSPVLSGGNASPHKIQGIGAGFVPKTLDTSVVDEIITVTDEEAYRYGKMIAQTEGLLVGISSGAALAAAVKMSEKEDNAGKSIVIILPDSGSRYLSTPNYL